MKSSAQVVVVGGGVVGASVLYHLTEAGWSDVVLLERKQLTAGSTWHAAGGMHTLNGDPNVSRLQQYTINLYKEIEARVGAELLDPPARRPDAGRLTGPHGLPAHGPGARSVPRHGPRDHLDRRGEGVVPDAGGEVLRRGAVRPRSRATSTRTG